MQETEITSGRHEINDLDNFEILAPQGHTLTQFRLLVLINDCTGVIAPLNYIANLINHRHMLAPDKMLMAKLEG